LAFDGVDVEVVDRLSTTGLCLAEQRLCRLLWADDDFNGPIECLCYDAGGVQHYFRVDGLAEPHDVAWDGRQFLVVSTATNSILRVTQTGTVTGRWQAAGSGDAWHLNNLLVLGDTVLVSAFGRFQEHRQWTREDVHGAGMVFDLTSGHDLLTGLSCPHNPRFFDRAWSVCNSKTGELLQFDAVSRSMRRGAQLHGWTRGVAVSGSYLFVGVSARRHDGNDRDLGRIAVVCRQTWKVLEEISIPCREVYDLVLVPAELLNGVRRGFRRQRTAAPRVQISSMNACDWRPQRRFQW
jgi:hypothetical protein